MLDLDFVRHRFPALASDWVLMDNAGGSVPLRGVIDRVSDYMAHTMVQLGATYELSVAAADAVEAGKQAAADLVGAEADEIVLGPSTTINAMLLAQALRPSWREGDEVVVTNLDHESNIAPWRALEATGIRIREWAFDPESLALRIEDLRTLLGDRTRIVCFTHCSNIVGSILDAKAIVAAIHEAGALACIDGVAFAPHRRVDVRALDADFYLLSLYKTYGPHLGLMYGKREHWERATSRNFFFVGPDAGTYRFEPGNVNHELTASLPAIPAYLAELSSRSGGDGTIASAFDAIAAHEASLTQPVLAFLRDRPGVRIVGSEACGPDRSPTISFVVEERDSAEIPALLEEEHVAIRYGHFYAYRAIEALGLLPTNGVVRISMVHYNTADEVARLLATLDRILS